MKTAPRKWAAIPGFVGVAAATAVLSAWQGAATTQDSVTTHDPGPPGWAYHGASSSQGFSPVQPIKFPHPLHVKGLGMNCLYCHNAAAKSPDPGIPAVSTCMGCHNFVKRVPVTAKQDSPEIAKLTKYWNDKQPIPWIRIHKVPEYVHFPHMRHVNAGVTCQTCHGQVQEMWQVYQYSSLNMGWCVNCHVNGYVPADGDKAAGSARTEIGPQTSSVANVTPAPGGAVQVYATAASITSPVKAGAVTQEQRNIGPSLATTPHKARYDCAVCHY
jgi:hypothetical protein